MSGASDKGGLRLPRPHGQGEAFAILVDGAPVEAWPGESVAAALLAAGRPLLRRTAGGAPRGLYCGMGVCWECAVLVEGAGIQRACMVEARPGLVVRLLSGRAPGDV